MLATVSWPNSSHGTDCILQQRTDIEVTSENRQMETGATSAVVAFAPHPGVSPFPSVNTFYPALKFKVQISAALELQTITMTNLGTSSTAKLSAVTISGHLEKLGQQ